METPSKARWLTPKVIAEKLELDPETVRVWCRSGKLKSFRIGYQFRIKPDDFDQFLHDRNAEYLTETAS